MSCPVCDGRGDPDMPCCECGKRRQLSQQSEHDLTLIRSDEPGWLGYDVYESTFAIGHVRRRVGGSEWAWSAPGMNAYVGFLPRRQDAVQMLLDLSHAAPLTGTEKP